jgi:hypothetical protein
MIGDWRGAAELESRTRQKLPIGKTFISTLGSTGNRVGDDVSW